MKKIIAFFIKHKVFTHSLFIVIIIAAILAYKNVPKELFPPSEMDKILIKGGYPGASPNLLNKMVVNEIEDDIKSYPEVSSIESVVSSGNFVITANLKPNVNKNELLTEFQSIVSNIKKDLPSDMNTPSVSIAKKLFPLMFISVGSKKLNKDELLNVAEDVKKKLLKIPYLTEVKIRGKSDKNIYIALDSNKIDALGLNKVALNNVISSLSLIFPIGYIEGKKHFFVNLANVDVEKLKNTIITINNKKVRLKDIADIKKEYDTPNQLGKYDGVKMLMIDVRKGEKGDAIAISHKIRTLLKEYHKNHPDVIFGISTDTSKWVRNRFNTVTSNITFGLILVFFLMWLFLNWRISLVVTLGIPTSFAIALICIDYLHYSLNLLSMLGMLIALGMIVDEAIVVGENIYRHMSMGKDKITAAIDGASEVFWPVMASSITTILAFLPMLLIKGEMGKFIKILPIIITILILSSLFEAFVFLPLHSMEILRVTYSKKEILWEKLANLYKKLLFYFFKFRYFVLVFFLIIVPFLTFESFKHSKFQLFPDFDTSQIYVNGRFDNSFNIYQTNNGVVPIEKVLKKYLGNDVEGFTTVIGMQMNNKGEANTGENYFHIFVDLKEKKPTDFYNKYIAPFFEPIKVTSQTRLISADELAMKIRKDLSKIKIPHIKELNVIKPQAGIIKSDIVISIGGDNRKVLNAIKVLEEKMKEVKGVYNIYDDALLGPSEIKISLNSYGKKLGFSEKDIFMQLRPFFSKAEFDKTFDKSGIVRLKFYDKNKDKLSFFKSFRLSIPNSNKFVLLNQVADFKIVKEFKKIHKYNGVAAKTVYATLNKKIITVKDFYQKFNPLLNKFKKEGLKILIGGAAKKSKEFMSDIKTSLVVALLLIFLVLVLMFNSAFLPFVIVSVIPLSFLGVFIGNMIMGMNLTMLGIIGIVGLAGVVVNDGIVMIDFIKNAKSVDEILTRASFRLRPILLTSLTTFFGLITLIFFPYGQSQILQPLAIALGFGIMWGTVLNLFYLPVFFYVLNKRKVSK